MNRYIAAATAVLLLAPLTSRAKEAKKDEELEQESEEIKKDEALEEKKEEVKVGGVKLNGMVDAYYTANLTTSQAVPNPLRAHDGNTGFRLNWAKLVASMDPEPAGFRIDLGFGPESNFTTSFFVLQAFASAKLGPGVLDFGQFVTPFGVEVFESKDNWLYTRGLIYQYVVPTVHQGARYTFEAAEGITLQASVFNGWESPADARLNPYDPANAVNTLSPYKTGHASILYSRGPITGAFGFAFGKEPGALDTRLLVDGNVGFAAGPLSVNLSAARRSEGVSDTRFGAAIAARYELTDALRISGRFEYLDDSKGAALGIVDTVGAPLAASAWDATLGASFAIGGNTELRAEYRYDKVSEDYFPRTDSPTPELIDGAATFHVAAIAWF